ERDPPALERRERGGARLEGVADAEIRGEIRGVAREPSAAMDPLRRRERVVGGKAMAPVEEAGRLAEARAVEERLRGDEAGGERAHAPPVEHPGLLLEDDGESLLVLERLGRPEPEGRVRLVPRV